MSDKLLVDEWLRFAADDLFTAHHLFEDIMPKRIEISCYHSQQCAEKSLKAFLIFKDYTYPKVHDLKVLCDLCNQIDPSFASIETICAHLTPFAVISRYPEQISPDESITKAAIQNAQQIYDFCFGKINPPAEPQP